MVYSPTSSGVHVAQTQGVLPASLVSFVSPGALTGLSGALSQETRVTAFEREADALNLGPGAPRQAMLSRHPRQLLLPREPSPLGD